MMVAFGALSQKQTRAFDAAGLAASGSDESQPTFCASYGVYFYVGYLLDPHGNKIAQCSSNLVVPSRDG